MQGDSLGPILASNTVDLDNEENICTYRKKEKFYS